MKKFAFLALALALVASLLTGCAGKPNPRLNAATLVIAGALGENPFYDLAADGLSRLNKDRGIKTTIIECNRDETAYAKGLQDAAGISEFAIALGFEFTDSIARAAEENPDIKFIFIDAVCELKSNIYNVTFKHNESAFLAGYIAAKVSANGKLGMVCGADNDVIGDYVTGFEQGAKQANPACTVEKTYIDTFDDQASGKAAANALIDGGCDVIYQLAGAAGLGALQACHERGIYAIGADGDQSALYPETVICSTLKNTGNAIYDTIDAYKADGTFAGNTRFSGGLKEGYVGISYGESSQQEEGGEPLPASPITDALKAEIASLQEKIINGDITVQTTR